MAQFQLTDKDFNWLTQTIMNIAHDHASNRIVSCLEGGYALSALGRCVSTHIRILAGLSQ